MGASQSLSLAEATSLIQTDCHPTTITAANFANAHLTSLNSHNTAIRLHQHNNIQTKLTVIIVPLDSSARLNILPRHSAKPPPLLPTLQQYLTELWHSIENTGAVNAEYTTSHAHTAVYDENASPTWVPPLGIADFVSAFLDTMYTSHDHSQHTGRVYLQPLHPNLPPIQEVVTGERAMYFITQSMSRSLHSLLRFNQRALESDSQKLFLFYQLTHTISYLHSRHTAHGDIQPSNIALTANGWLQLTGLTVPTSLPPPPSPSAQLPDSALMQWVRGDMSNYDYLMILNKLAGRTVGADAADHPILPWVVDFTSQTIGWRDLSRSKFRLKKGDDQLDFTYANATVPHHITELFSDITYYVYLSRVTPIDTLKRIVRDRFVAAEYPPSMQRIYQWTPDECIPEFYTDASIFVSDHKEHGLDDLAIPEWTKDVSTFLEWHRSMLESDYVSQRLNEWIDITFGHKLSGVAAIEAKNVPLKAQKQSSRRSAFVQLFTSPHPMKMIKKSTNINSTDHLSIVIPSSSTNALSTNGVVQGDSAKNGSKLKSSPLLPAAAPAASPTAFSLSSSSPPIESNGVLLPCVDEMQLYMHAATFDIEFCRLAGCYNPLYNKAARLSPARGNNVTANEFDDESIDASKSISDEKIYRILCAGDMFSLGCILAELFAFQPLFTHQTHRLYALNKYKPSLFHLPLNVAQVVADLIHLDPLKRMSARELLRHQIFSVSETGKHTLIPVYEQTYEFVSELRRQQSFFAHISITSATQTPVHSANPQTLTIIPPIQSTTLPTDDIHTPPARTTPLDASAILTPPELSPLVMRVREREREREEREGRERGEEILAAMERSDDDEPEHVNDGVAEDDINAQIDSLQDDESDANDQAENNGFRVTMDDVTISTSTAPKSSTTATTSSTSESRALATLDWTFDQLEQLTTLPADIYILLVPHVLTLCQHADITLASLDLFDTLGRQLGKNLSGVHLAPVLHQLLLHVDNVDLQCDLVNISFLRVVRARFAYFDFFREYLSHVRNSLLSPDWRVSEMSAATLYQFTVIDLDMRSDLDLEILVRELLLPMFHRLGRPGSEVILTQLCNIASEVDITFVSNILLPNIMNIIEKSLLLLLPITSVTNRNENDIKLGCVLDLLYSILPDIPLSMITHIFINDFSIIKTLLQAAQHTRPTLSPTTLRKCLKLIIALLVEVSSDSNNAPNNLNNINTNNNNVSNITSPNATDSNNNNTKTDNNNNKLGLKHVRLILPLLPLFNDFLTVMSSRLENALNGHGNSGTAYDIRTCAESMYTVYSSLYVLLGYAMVKKAIANSSKLESQLTSAPSMGSASPSPNRRRASLQSYDVTVSSEVDRARKHSALARQRRSNLTHRLAVRSEERQKVRFYERGEKGTQRVVDDENESDAAVEGAGDSDQDDDGDETAETAESKRASSTPTAASTGGERKSIFSWLTPSNSAENLQPRLTPDITDMNAWILEQPTPKHSHAAGQHHTPQHSFKLKSDCRAGVRAHRGPILSIHTHPYNGLIATASKDEQVKLWSVGVSDTGLHCLSLYKGHRSAVTHVRMLCNELNESMPQFMASTDGTVHLWDIETTKAKFVCGGGLTTNAVGDKSKSSTLQSAIVSFEHVASRNALLLGTSIGTLKWLDIASGTLSGPWRHLGAAQPISAVRCLCASKSCWIGTGLTSGELTVFDDRTGVIRLQWRAHEAAVISVDAVSDYGLVSVGADKTICVWDVRNSEPTLVQRWSGMDESAKCLTLHHNDFVCGIGATVGFGQITASSLSSASSITVPTARRAPQKLNTVNIRVKGHKSRANISAVAMLNCYKTLLMGTEEGKILFSG